MASLRPHIRETRNGGAISRAVIGRISTLPTSLASAVAAGRARAGRVVALPAATIYLSAAMLAGGFIAGAIFSAQWQARSPGAIQASAPVTRQSGREIVAATIDRLEDEQTLLKGQIATLREELNEVQNGDVKRKSTLQDLNNEIARQRVASGMVALSGPGIVVTMDDSAAHSIPENEDPANYILHEYDLRDVLNTLWAAGAEAVSINGERIVSSTSLYCVGTTIICNATRLSPPYEVRAVGDPDALASALHGSTQMAKFNQRAEIYDLPVSIVAGADVAVPAYNGSFVFKYATVQGQQ
jgi:uncharacterized protein YlxW (UPF0749 family)